MVLIFDTAVGGLGGTPFGAPEVGMGFWNIPTEDLVHLFDQMGVNTGVNSGLLLGRKSHKKCNWHVLKSGGYM